MIAEYQPNTVVFSSPPVNRFVGGLGSAQPAKTPSQACLTMCRIADVVRAQQRSDPPEHRAEDFRAWGHHLTHGQTGEVATKASSLPRACCSSRKARVSDQRPRVRRALQQHFLAPGRELVSALLVDDEKIADAATPQQSMRAPARTVGNVRRKRADSSPTDRMSSRTIYGLHRRRLLQWRGIPTSSR